MCHLSTNINFSPANNLDGHCRISRLNFCCIWYPKGHLYMDGQLIMFIFDMQSSYTYITPDARHWRRKIILNDKKANKASCYEQGSDIVPALILSNSPWILMSLRSSASYTLTTTV